jgi:hypothetical protein
LRRAAGPRVASPPALTRPPAQRWGRAARRAGRLHPPPWLQTGREGGGGGGTEPSAIFPYSPKHTHTHTHTLSGRRRGNELGHARPPGPGAEEGKQGSPRPGRRHRGRNLAHTLAHPSRPPPLSHIQLLAPERRVAPARLATHRTTQASSHNQDTRRRDGSRRRQSWVPVHGLTWVHPRPGGGDGRQSVSRGCGGPLPGVKMRGLHADA